MNIYYLVVTLAVLSIVGLAWIKMVKPWYPTMLYKTQRPVTYFIHWFACLHACMFILGTVEYTYTVTTSSISPIWNAFGIHLCSFVFCHFFLKNIVYRPLHPAPFIMPTSLHFISFVAFYIALEHTNYADLVATKILRIGIVALFFCKRDKLYWVLLSICLSMFLFQYKWFDTWSLPNTTGLLSLITFMVADSYCSISQEVLFKRFSVEPITMMYYINLFYCIILAPQLYMESTALVVLTPYHPFIVCFYMFVQYYTLRIIKHFGALIFMLAMAWKTVIVLTVGNYIWYERKLEIYEILPLVILSVLTFVLLRRLHIRTDIGRTKTTLSLYTGL